MSIIRTSGGVLTMNGASLPAFGTTLSAASTISVDPYSGNTNPGSNLSISKLTVASNKAFQTGDNVLVGPKNQFIPGGSLDAGVVLAIDTTNHILTVQGLLKAHASGDYVVVNNDCSSVAVIPLANAAVVYVGYASTVSSTDSSLYDAIPISSGTLFYTSQLLPTSNANSYKTSETWLIGTSSDTLIARYVPA